MYNIIFIFWNNNILYISIESDEANEIEREKKRVGKIERNWERGRDIGRECERKNKNKFWTI